MKLPIPLLTPTRRLSEPERERYRRNWLTYGEHAQERVAAARVLVVGVGGLGSPVLLYLAAAGVGTLGICDGDIVEIHNLQRQLLHAEHNEGDLKTRSGHEHLRALNSGVHIEEFGLVTEEFLDEVGHNWDLIIDCSDNFPTKYLLADWCARSGVPLVWGTVVATTFQVSVFWANPPEPLPPLTLRHLYPHMPQPGQTPSSLEVGVIGSIVGQAGTAMASEALKLITGVGDVLFGKVLVADPHANRYDTVAFVSLETATS